MIELEKVNNSGCWYSFKLDDGDTKITIKQPKCRCMSCEYLDIDIEDEDGTRKYELYTHGTENQQLSDFITTICMLSDAIGK